MQQHTNVSIDGTKTTLLFGSYYDFELRDGRTLRHVKPVSRAANGDLEIAGTDDGPTAKLRPSKIVGVVGSGIDVGPSRADLADAVRRLVEDEEGGSFSIRQDDDSLDPDDPESVAFGSDDEQDDDVEPAPSRESLIRDLESGSAVPEDFEHPYFGRDSGVGPCSTCGEPFSGTRAHFVDGTATPVPVAPVVVIDEDDRPVWTSEASLDSPVVESAIATLRSGRVRLPSETASGFVERLERELSSVEYARWVRSDRGQAALERAAEESKAARSGRYASGREAVAKVLRVRKVAAPVDVVVETARTSGSTGRIDGEPSASSKRAIRTAPAAKSKPETAPDGSKRCSGVPKREIAPHVSPVSDFGTKRTAKDGLSSTCKVCHKIYAELGRAKRQEAKVAS